jgi:hypothetical protein
MGGWNPGTDFAKATIRKLSRGDAMADFLNYSITFSVRDVLYVAGAAAGVFAVVIGLGLIFVEKGGTPHPFDRP